MDDGEVPERMDNFHRHSHFHCVDSPHHQPHGKKKEARFQQVMSEQLLPWSVGVWLHQEHRQERDPAKDKTATNPSHKDLRLLVLQRETAHTQFRYLIIARVCRVAHITHHNSGSRGRWSFVGHCELVAHVEKFVTNPQRCPRLGQLHLHQTDVTMDVIYSNDCSTRTHLRSRLWRNRRTRRFRFGITRKCSGGLIPPFEGTGSHGFYKETFETVRARTKTESEEILSILVEFYLDIPARLRLRMPQRVPRLLVHCLRCAGASGARKHLEKCQNKHQRLKSSEILL
mmetsp:Transcript_9707/g.27032  ORF Transcript_9707/g.27032 Transcript_9707/m.27032 type:complete len:286 (-) Transcript_9707:336-1193(-)